jgi:Pterin 4 alpha carbinolamine dehydratase
MRTLAEKHCVHAQQLPDWKIIEDHHIARSLRFPDFKSALDFVNQVGAVAGAEGRHPDPAQHSFLVPGFRRRASVLLIRTAALQLFPLLLGEDETQLQAQLR